MKEKARSERLIGTEKRVELNRQVELRKFQKERQKYKKEGKSFAKSKSTIEGQRDSEAGDVEKREEMGLQNSRRKS